MRPEADRAGRYSLPSCTAKPEIGQLHARPRELSAEVRVEGVEQQNLGVRVAAVREHVANVGVA